LDLTLAAGHIVLFDFKAKQEGVLPQWAPSFNEISWLLL